MISRIALVITIQTVAGRPEIDLLTEWCYVPDLEVASNIPDKFHELEFNSMATPNLGKGWRKVIGLMSN